VTDLPKDSGKIPELETAPDGTPAIKHVYPEGQLSKGNMLNFYTKGPEGAINLDNAKEVMLTYKVWFNEDWDWVKGGKLPGMYGGTDPASAKGCSGGDQREDCFSARVMWRKDGDGELYNYWPTRDQWYCSAEGPNNSKSVCDSMGESVFRGAFRFDKGRWIELTQRLRLNDVGQSNGEQELFVDGESKILLQNIEIRKQDDVKFQGLMAQSFFGGSKDDFKPPKDETAFFTGFGMTVLSEF